MPAKKTATKKKVTKKTAKAKTPAISTVGTALEEALSSSDFAVAPATDSLRLAGFEVFHPEGTDETLLTAPAQDRLEGVCIVGPGTQYAGMGSQDLLLRQTRIRRWVYRPCDFASAIEVDKDGKTRPIKGSGPRNVLASRGSICITHKVIMECTRCEQTKEMWMDAAATLRRNGNSFCRKCLTAEERKAQANGAEMRQRRLNTRLVPVEGGANDDPVYSGIDDPHVIALDETFSGTPQHTPFLFPRMWAIYKADAPLDFTDGCKGWEPEDDKAAAIEASARAQGLTIRPFKMLVDAQNEGIAALREAGGGRYEGTGLHAVVIEAPHGFHTGWVSREDVMGGIYNAAGELDDVLGLGFTRRFEQKPSGAGSRRARGVAL